MKRYFLVIQLISLLIAPCFTLIIGNQQAIKTGACNMSVYFLLTYVLLAINFFWASLSTYTAYNYPSKESFKLALSLPIIGIMGVSLLIYNLLWEFIPFVLIYFMILSYTIYQKLDLTNQSIS